MAVECGNSVTLQQGYVVECEHMKGVWFICDFENIEGAPYYRLNPFNSGLSRFITAASRGLRERKSPWFTETRNLRDEERVKRVLHGIGAPFVWWSEIGSETETGDEACQGHR